MGITLSNENTNTAISLSNENKVAAGMTWDEATNTWTDQEGTWDYDKLILSKESKL